MVTAPRPGATTKPQRIAIEIKFGHEVYRLNMRDLGPEDDLLARQQTGFPCTPFMNDDKFGADSIAVLIWMARRKRGERRLHFREVVKEMPGFMELGEMLDDGRLDIEVLEEETGKALDAASEEVEHDPLPSAEA